SRIMGLPGLLRLSFVTDRAVKDTGNRSAHAWGVAIDINTKFADYWLWAKNGACRNQIPFEIVEVFERHGFIWGGKWAHFDTMPYEYRPELLGGGGSMAARRRCVASR